MAEKKPSKQQIFSQVKQLCFQGNFRSAHALICQTAEISAPDILKISGDYIKKRTPDKIIHQMLDVEQAFVAVAKTFNQETPEEHRAAITSKLLKNILPLLSRSEKLTAYYWINNCYAYMENVSPQERTEALNNIISLSPEKTQNTLLYSCANQVIDLDIPSKEKYNLIKQAYKKTDKKSPTIPHLKDLLNKTGRPYFDSLRKQLRDTRLDYNTRQQAAYTAVKVCNDFNTSVSKKCHLKIEVLQELHKLQIQQQDKAGIKTTTTMLCKYATQLENIKNIMGSNRTERDWYR